LPQRPVIVGCAGSFGHFVKHFYQPAMSNIRQQLKDYIDRSVMSAEGIATMIGIPQSQLGRYIGSDGPHPRYDALARLFLAGAGQRIEEIGHSLARLRKDDNDEHSAAAIAAAAERRRFLHWQRAQLMNMQPLLTGRPSKV